jgi:DNA-binding transcriptional LysR family regulator
VLSLSKILALNAVYETGSFSAAARQLAMSQSAVNQQVRDMEREFSVKLFDRRSNGLVPTRICHQLFVDTAAIQVRQQSVLSLLNKQRELKSGELRVGLGNSMPGMKLIAGFRQQYPDVQVKVEMGSWSQIIDAVVDQRVDVGLLPDLPKDSRFDRVLCLHQRVVAIAHLHHPLAGRRNVSCSQLAGHSLIFRTPSSSTQRVVNRAFAAASIEPEPIIVLNTRDGVIEAVANGMGIGFIWEHASSRRDGIVRLNVTDMDEQLPEYLFLLKGNRNRLVEGLFQLAAAPTQSTGKA